MSDGDGGDPACWAHLVTGAGPRRLPATATGELLAAGVVAHLATLDAGGFPHVTPIWFLWDGEAFLMTSLPERPHVARLRADRRAGLVVDVEDGERDDGQRPNRQVRVTGEAEVLDDDAGTVTRAITAKYLAGPAAAARAEERASRPRVVLRLVPRTWVALTSV